MIKPYERDKRSPILIKALLISLMMIIGAACQPEAPPIASTATPPASLTPTMTPLPSPMITPSAPKIIIISSEDMAAGAHQQAYYQIETLGRSAGWSLERYSQVDRSHLSAGTRLIVFFTPDDNISELASNHPQIAFLTVGLAGIQPQPNLTVIGPEGYRVDQQAFAAGYLAAVLTKEWRIGLLLHEEIDASDDLSRAFSNGVIYYCGLCRPIYPPFHRYPVMARIPPKATEKEWMSALEQLFGFGIRTVFIYADDIHQAAAERLQEMGILYFGTSSAPSEAQDLWAGTLRFAPEIPIAEYWDEILSVEYGSSLPMPLILDHANRSLVSYGRQSWAQRVFDDLIAGWIDTGVAIPIQKADQ